MLKWRVENASTCSLRCTISHTLIGDSANVAAIKPRFSVCIALRRSTIIIIHVKWIRWQRKIKDKKTWIPWANRCWFTKRKIIGVRGVICCELIIQRPPTTITGIWVHRSGGKRLILVPAPANSRCWKKIWGVGLVVYRNILMMM